MLDIWKHITELSFRGFGIKKRKKPKTPGNFKEWSKESQEKWLKNMEDTYKRNRKWDEMFIENESRVVDDLCRKIVHLIDQANILHPYYLFEWEDQRRMQDEAIGLCSNLKQELNHIADTIPCNKNFLTIQTEDIEKEIALIRGWRRSCNSIRDKVKDK